MAETPDGMAALRQKVERRSRIVPPPRHPAKGPEPTDAKDEERLASASRSRKVREHETTAGTDLPADSNGSEAENPGTSPSTKARATLSGTHWLRDPVPPNPNEPMANLAIRVRKSLDDRLADVVHDLKRKGVRSSKAELIELLISTLPEVADDDALTLQLKQFRQLAPRP